MKILELDLEVLREEVKRAIELACNYGNKINLDNSPVSIHRQLAERCIFQELMSVLDMLLAGVELTKDGIPNWEISVVNRTLSKSATKLQQLRARDYAYCLTLALPPYFSCQIYNGSSNDSSVVHQGTGRRRARGGGSGGFMCDGPLRTEKELMLGMCGSCLKRYGPTIGTPILSSEENGKPLPDFRARRPVNVERSQTTPEDEN